MTSITKHEMQEEKIQMQFKGAMREWNQAKEYILGYWLRNNLDKYLEKVEVKENEVNMFKFRVKEPIEAKYTDKDGNELQVNDYNIKQHRAYTNWKSEFQTYDKDCAKLLGSFQLFVTGGAWLLIKDIVNNLGKSKQVRADEAWKKLLDTYERSDTSQVVNQLIQELHGINESEGVTKMIDKAMKINDEIALYDSSKRYDSNALKTLIVSKIKNPAFDSLIGIVQHTKDGTSMDFETLASKLKHIEDMKNGKSCPIESGVKRSLDGDSKIAQIKALKASLRAVRSMPDDRPKMEHKEHGWKQGKFDDKKKNFQKHSFPSHENKAAFTGTCFNCGKKGHRKSECRSTKKFSNEKFAVKSREREKELSGPSAVQRVMKMVRTVGEDVSGEFGYLRVPRQWMSQANAAESGALQVNMMRHNVKAAKVFEDDWAMIDSGANVSVISRKEAERLDATVVPMNSTMKITLADGAIMVAKWKADLGPIIGQAVVLDHVDTTVISVGQLLERGFHVELTSSNVCIKDNMGEVVCVGVVVENLFYVKISDLVKPYLITDFSYTKSTTTKLNPLRKSKEIPKKIVEEIIALHEAMGHIDAQSMVAAVEAGAWIMGPERVDVITAENIRKVFQHYDCLSCKLGKRNRIPIGAGAGIGSKVVGNVLSLDYVGKINPPAYNGINGFYLFSDLATGYLHAVLVRTKTALKNAVNDVVSFYKRYQHTVRCLRFDSDSLQLSDDFTLWLDNYNPPILYEASCPGSQNQNPVERQVQTLIKGVSTILHAQTSLTAEYWNLAVLAWIDARNAMPNKVCGEMSPLEAVTGSKPDIELKFRFPFGQPVVVGRLNLKRKAGSSTENGEKFVTKNEIGIAIASADGKNKGVLVYFPEKKRLLVREDVSVIMKSNFKPGAPIPVNETQAIKFFAPNYNPINSAPMLSYDESVKLISTGENTVDNEMHSSIGLEDCNMCGFIDEKPQHMYEEVSEGEESGQVSIEEDIAEFVATNETQSQIRPYKYSSNSDRSSAMDKENEASNMDYTTTEVMSKEGDNASNNSYLDVEDRLEKATVEQNVSDRSTSKYSLRSEPRKSWKSRINKIYASYISVVSAMKRYRSKKSKRKIDNFDEPSVKNALSSSMKQDWEFAILKEFKNIEDHKSFQVISKENIPSEAIVIPTNMLLKIKRLANTNHIDKLKARLVVLGNHLRKIYDELVETLYSPTAKTQSVNLLLALAARLGLILGGFDVKGAFLYPDLEEEIYVKLPENVKYIVPASMWGKDGVWKLLKTLYGLPQSPKAFYDFMTNLLRQNGYNPTVSDPCFFVKRSEKGVVLLVVHVDDIAVAASNQQLIKELREVLLSAFDLNSVESLDNYTGVHLEYLDDGSIQQVQPGYVERLLSEHGLDGDKVKIASTPMALATKNSKCVQNGANVSGKILCEESLAEDNQCEENVYDENLCDKTAYQSLLGALVYLSRTRPDIAYAVGWHAMHMQCPMIKHMAGLKRILRYLKGTPHLGVTFDATSQEGEETRLYCWCDAAFDVHPDSTSQGGYCFSLGLNTGMFFSRSFKIKDVAMSSTEAEHTAVVKALQDVIWFRTLLEELGFPQDKPTVIFEDNKSTIVLSTNYNGNHRKVKHMVRKIAYVMQHVNEYKTIVFEYLPSEWQVADILTKALGPMDFIRLRDILMGMKKHLVEFNEVEE